jgi:hypothetical protein
MKDFHKLLILVFVVLITIWADMPGLGILFSIFTLINNYAEWRHQEELKKKYTPLQLEQLRIINFGTL